MRFQKQFRAICKAHKVFGKAVGKDIGSAAKEFGKDVGEAGKKAGKELKKLFD